MVRYFGPCITLKIATIPPQRLQFFALSGFVLLGLLGILNHAIWRDEMNVWLIVRDSLTIPDFFAHIRYEGHPLLWYLSLALVNQWGDDPVLMQGLHLSLGIGAMVLLWKCGPFPPWQKLLLTFSYYPFYEYLLISRNYGIGMLFMFSFCVAWPRRHQTYLGVGLFIALMANCNAYGLFIGFALLLTLGMEWWFYPELRPQGWGNVWGGVGVAIAGLAASLYMLIPPSDSQLQGGLSSWFFAWDWHQFGRALSRVWSGYFLLLIPGDSRGFDGFLFGTLAVGLLGFWAIALCRRPIALCFYLFASGEIIAFSYIKFLGTLRHYGSLFLVLIIALWIAVDCLPWQIPPQFTPLKSLNQWVKRAQTPLFALILTAHLIAGLIAYVRDYITPFSASKATAAYIEQQDLNREFIVGSRDANMAPLAGYLHRQIYYPERGELGSFTLFNAERQDVGPEEVLAQVTTLLNTHRELLLILNYPLELTPPHLFIEPLAEFRRVLVETEQYFLYHISLGQKP
ncbi:MAG: hypothetical protein EA366_03530 [Spirulina sp. DLM2.Bin59]|nr:MAG: hypothetical protein EA366_03530 [Spirulina sp. DLM2.Bin59]